MKIISYILKKAIDRSNDDEKQLELIDRILIFFSKINFTQEIFEQTEVIFNLKKKKFWN